MTGDGGLGVASDGALPEQPEGAPPTPPPIGQKAWTSSPDGGRAGRRPPRFVLLALLGALAGLLLAVGVGRLLGGSEPEPVTGTTPAASSAGQTEAPAPLPASTTAPATPAPTSTGDPTAALDQQVTSGVTAIQIGILTWASEHGGLFPAVFQVSEEGEVGGYVDPWPANPFSESPMVAGTTPGDFFYEQLDAGRGYRLTGYLGDGATLVVP